MKTRRPFLALVQLEIEQWFISSETPLIARLGLFGLLLAGNLLPAGLILFQRADGDFTLFLPVWLGVLLAFGISLTSSSCSSALIRDLWINMPSYFAPCAEFLGSRAISRQMRFRAKTAMLILLLVVPLALNLALVAWRVGESVVASDYDTSRRGGVVARPDLTSTEIPAASQRTDLAEMLARSRALLLDATNFCAASLWGAAAVVVLIQGFVGLLSRLWRAGGKLTVGVLLGLEMLTGILAPMLIAQLAHGAFVFRVGKLFSDNWLSLTVALVLLAVPVQLFCERQFAEQEVL